MSNLPTIITFPFPAEHSEAFLLSRYRTTVETALVSGGQMCRFIPDRCKPHASHMWTAHWYAKQVSGSCWGALFAISLSAVGGWCTGREPPAAAIAAHCPNEFYISRQMKHSTKWKAFRIPMLPGIRICCAWGKKDCGCQCAVTNLDKVPLYNASVLKLFKLVKYRCGTAAELSLQTHMLSLHTHMLNDKLGCDWQPLTPGRRKTVYHVFLLNINLVSVTKLLK